MNNISQKAAVPGGQASDSSLQTSITNLKNKLMGFTVLGEQGQILGEVRDIVLDGEHCLNLVVAQTAQTGEMLSLFNTKSVQKVSLKLRQVVVGETDGSEGALPHCPSTAELAPEAAGAAATPSNASLENPATGAIPAAESEIATGTIAESPISLLAERLQVEYQRRKIGEVIIRKKVETRTVEVPVRYERLIVEQVSPERKQLADVALGDDRIGEELAAMISHPVVSGEFASPRVASQVLDAIAKTLHHRCRRIRIEVELEDESLRDTYQSWMDQYSR